MGSTIAVADDAGDVYLYNGEKPQTPGAPSFRSRIRRSGGTSSVDGSWAAAAVDQVRAVGIAFDPDGNVLAATGHDHTVKFFLTSNLRLIGTDLHAAATRGVVFAAKGPTAFTYGDDGIVNKLASLSASSSIRIGDVAGFAVASEWLKSRIGSRPLKVPARSSWFSRTWHNPAFRSASSTVAVGVASPSVQPPSSYVRGPWFSVREYPLTPTGRLTCPAGGLGHPNESGNVETVQRLIRGTRTDQVTTITRPAVDGPSHLRLWNATDCSQQWRHDYDGSPEQASTGSGVVGTIEGKSTVRLFAPLVDKPIAEVTFSSELSAVAVAPKGDAFAVITSDRKRLCICNRSPPAGSANRSL